MLMDRRRRTVIGFVKPAECPAPSWRTLGARAGSRFGLGILPDNHLPQKQGVAQFETGY